MLEIILVQDFCPLKIKITQFPGGFRLNIPTSTFLTHYAPDILVHFWARKGKKKTKFDATANTVKSTLAETDALGTCSMCPS